MNQKTAKLLKKWATASKETPRAMKKWWMSLNRHQRGKERRRILENLGDK